MFARYAATASRYSTPYQVAVLGRKDKYKMFEVTHQFIANLLATVGEETMKGSSALTLTKALGYSDLAVDLRRTEPQDEVCEVIAVGVGERVEWVFVACNPSCYDDIH
jgi:hypothetical protein